MPKKILFLLFCSQYFLSHAQMIRKNDPSINYEGYTFIENKGQFIEKVNFQVELPAGRIQLCDDRVRYTFTEERKYYALLNENHPGNPIQIDDRTLNHHRFDVMFKGAQTPSGVKGLNELPYKTNYFVGKQAHWASGVKKYQAIQYENLYPQIDFLMYEKNGALKYEFQVAPKTDPDQIQMELNGVDDLEIVDGHLIIRTTVNGITEKPPYAYQIIKGQEVEVSCDFKLEGNVLSYELGRYNKKYPLVIDPQLIFSTYSGSTLDNWGNTACLDRRSNLYTGGTIFPYSAGTTVDSLNGSFPTTVGAFQTEFQGGDTDIGILKFDSSGVNLEYATHIGGSDAEIPTSTITNERGELFILGVTSSPDFPTTEGAVQREFQGSLPEVQWIHNDSVVGVSTSLDITDFGNNDSIRVVVNHSSRCASPRSDTSDYFVVNYNNQIEAELAGSDTIFCPGDTLFFGAFPSVPFDGELAYEWSINNDSFASDTSIIQVNIPNDGDEIVCVISASGNCPANPLADTIRFTLRSALNQVPNPEIFFESITDTFCFGDATTFGIRGGFIGRSNYNVIWYRNSDTLFSGSNNTLTIVPFATDTIGALVVMSNQCFASDSVYTDSIIFNPTSSNLSHEIDVELTLGNRDRQPCFNQISVNVSTSPYYTDLSNYRFFLNNTLETTRTDTSAIFTGINDGDIIRVEAVPNSQCIDTAVVFDTVDFNNITDVHPRIVPNTVFSSCEAPQRQLTLQIAERSNIFANSNVDPIIGYSFTQGTDIVVVKLSQNGDSLLASTLMGGSGVDGITYPNDVLSHNYGDPLRGDVNIDSEDNIYVVSTTSSRDFPNVNAFQTNYGGGATDAVIFKLNRDMTDIEWSSYLGGDQMETGFSIKRDTSNNVFVTGGTSSLDFPTTKTFNELPGGGESDSYVAYISQDGTQLLESIKFGTNAYDQSYFLELDQDSDLYLLGQTEGAYPVQPRDIYHNPNSGIFLHKINNGLDSTVYSTVIGDLDSTNAIRPNISPTAFLVNECENIFISGWGGGINASPAYAGSNVFNMPVSPSAFQTATDGADFYMMVLLQDADSLLYSTYFGGPISEEHVDGGTSRFDDRGIVYQSVCAGCGGGGRNDFPQFPEPDNDPNTYPQPNRSGNCNNGVFKYDLANIEAFLDAPEGCNNLTVTFENNSVGGVTYNWDFGDGTDTSTIERVPVTHTFPSSGRYEVTLEVIDLTTCKRRSEKSMSITVHDSLPENHYYDTICIGETQRISVDAALRDQSYLWTPSQHLTGHMTRSPLFTADTSITYLVIITDTIGCERVDTFSIFVPQIQPDFTTDIKQNCKPGEPPAIDFFNTSISNGDDVLTYQWNFGNGQTSNERDVIGFRYESIDTFTVVLRVGAEDCILSRSQTIELTDVNLPNIFSPNEDGVNDTYEIIKTVDDEWFFQLYNRWGKLLYEDESYDNDYTAEGIEDGTYYYYIKSPDGSECKGWVQIVR